MRRNPISLSFCTLIVALSLLGGAQLVAQVDSTDTPGNRNGDRDTVYQVLVDPAGVDTAFNSGGNAWDFRSLGVLGVDTVEWRPAAGQPFADSVAQEDLVTSFSTFLTTPGSFNFLPREYFEQAYMRNADSALLSLGNGLDSTALVTPGSNTPDTFFFHRQFAPITPAEPVFPFPLDESTPRDCTAHEQRFFGERYFFSPGQQQFVRVPIRVKRNYARIIEGTGRRGRIRLPGETGFSTQDAYQLKLEVREQDSVHANYTGTPGNYRTFWFAFPVIQTRYVWVLPDSWEVFTLVLDASGQPEQAIYSRLNETLTAPQAELPPSPYVVQENVGTAQIPVTLSYPDNANSRSVNFSFVDGSAANGSDYNGVNGTVSFPPGDTLGFVPVDIVNNGLPGQPDRDFLIQLAPSATTGPRDTVRVTIREDDIPRISFVSPDTLIRENAGNLSLPLQLSTTSTQAIRARVTTYARTATPSPPGAPGTGDYDSTSTDVLFVSQAQQSNIVIPINDNSLVQATREFVVRVDSVVSGTAVVGLPDTLVVRIVDDENNIQFVDTDIDTFEAVGVLNLRVELSNPSPLPYTVRYRTEDLTATGDSLTTAGDYQRQNDTLSFAPGVTSQTISIPVRNDSTHEPDEDFRVILFDPQGGIGLGPRDSLLVTILDNDPDPNSRPELDPYELELAPNPAGTFSQLLWSVAPEAVSLLGINGQLLRSWTPEPGSQSLRLEVADLPQGVYLLRAHGPRGEWTRRLQISR